MPRLLANLDDITAISYLRIRNTFREPYYLGITCGICLSDIILPFAAGAWIMRLMQSRLMRFRVTKLQALSALCIALVVVSSSSVCAQAPAPVKPPSAQASPVVDAKALRPTMERLTTLRDAFVQKTVAAGFHCPIAPPVIVLTDVASFGNYDPSNNTLQTPAWEQLSSDEREFFFHLAGPNSDEAAARESFETGTHRWVFVHELGHWWQTCIGSNEGRTHYQVEYDANRIAAADWREVDSSLMTFLNAGFGHPERGSQSGGHRSTPTASCRAPRPFGTSLTS